MEDPLTCAIVRPLKSEFLMLTRLIVSLVIALGALGTAFRISAASLVLPPEYQNVDAANGAGDLIQQFRMQTIYSSTYFSNSGPILIQELRYRPSAKHGYPFNVTISSVEIRVSTTTVPVSGLQNTLDNNYGANNTLVFSGPATISSQFIGPVNGPKEFDISFPFIAPFLYDPSAGNLLIELRHIGSEQATYIDVATPSDGRAKRAYVLNPNGATGSSDAGADIVQLILAEPNAPPRIFTQPTNQNVALGGTANFAVGASGASLRYQWWFNGSPLPNATNSALTLSNVTSTQIGNYFVAITNQYGGTNSAVASLQVFAVPPGIATQPQSKKVPVGTTAQFSVIATGSPPFSYQWSVGGVPIIDATNATLMISNASIQNEGLYRVVVTTPYGQVTSSTAALQLLEPTSFFDQPEPPGPCNRRSPLVISEIMYHPKARTDGRELEFVEIYNSGEIPIRLDGYRLSGEIDYTFPLNTTIGARGYLVVAPSPADIQAVYELPNVLGGFTNKLSNSGGNLRLRNVSDAVLVDVTYSDESPWPIAADGAGSSLVMVRPSLGERQPQAWGSSAEVGGSPGYADPAPSGALTRLSINEVLAHTNAAAVFVEIYNRGGANVDLSSCIITDDPNTNRFRFSPGATVPARGSIAVTGTELGFVPDPHGGSIYLLNANATVVVDALRLGGHAPGVSQGRSPNGARNWRELAVATPNGSNAPPLSRPIVINELMYHPISGDNDDQFIELYNRSSNSVNVGGWRFTSGINFTIPSGTVIPALGYLAVAKNAARMLSNYPTLTPAKVVGNFSDTLSGRGEKVSLAKPELVVSGSSTTTAYAVVNEVNYGTGGRWGQWADGGGASLELIDPLADNQLANNWTDSQPPNNSPFVTIEYTGPHEFWDQNSPLNGVEISLQGKGECIVDDVEVIPNGGANQLSNPGFTSQSGWSFDGNHELSTIDNAGGVGNGSCLHIRASSRGDYLANRINGAWGTALSQSIPATIRLKARWLRGWPEVLMRLRGNTLEAAGRLIVPSNLGTPGSANSRLLANAGPAIWEVSHTPVLPAANQAVVVTARVSDPNGVTNVALRFRIDPSNTVNVVAMRDDGTGGDLTPGDGIYSGTIPGFAAGSLAAFHIRANDGRGAVTNFPTDAPLRECLIRFGETIPSGSFGAYRIWMTAATKSAWNGRSYPQVNNRPLDVTFVYNDQRVIYNAGAAYNGSDNTSTLYNGPDARLCGYTLNFPADDLFLNADEAVLDWPTRDATAQREQTTYWMASKVGLPHNYRRYVRLYVNGIGAESRPQPYGNGTQIYEDLQTPGSDFLEQWYEGGELYKLQVWRRDYKFPPAPPGESYHAALKSYVNQAGKLHLPRYRWNWRKRAVQDSANDYSKLLDLVAVGNAPNSPNYFAAVNSFMNVEQWMRVFAWERVIGNLDSYGNRNGHNMYAVVPSGKRWQLLTFDNDLVLGSDTSEGTSTDLFSIFTGLTDYGVPDPVAITRLRDGTWAAKRAYWRAFQDFVNGPMQTSNYGPEVNAKYAALQANGVIQDTGSAVASPTSFTSWIDGRRNFIQSQLASVAASFAVSTPPNNFSTNRNLVTLTGTAPVSVRDLRVNGVEAVVTWVDVITWSIQAVLTNGLNVLTISGVDGAGNTNFTSTRNITFSGSADTADKSLVFNEVLTQGTNSQTEFVELYNRSTTTAFDLSGWRINGLDFNFPAGRIIAPGAYFIVARDQIAFGKNFGFQIPVAGEFSGELDLDGETLTLIRVSGTNESVVTRATYRSASPWPVTTNGNSLQLIDATQSNQWVANWVTASPTPGALNNGAASLPQIPLVWLNEIQPTNSTGITDGLAEHEPWVELFNAETNAVSLANFYLTSDYTNLTAWQFAASATIPPGAFALVWLDGQTNQNSPTEWHANFRAAPFQGSIALVMVTGGRTSVVDYLNYSVSGPDRSFGSFPDAQPRERHELYFATAGATNSDALPLPPIKINEWMAANSTGILNPINGDRDDWFELYNPSTDVVDLGGFTLTDDLLNPFQYTIPTNVFIAPHGFVLVWAEGNSRRPDTNGGLHVNFKLSASGESIALFAPNGEIVDLVTFTSQTNDISQGRWVDGSGAFFFMTEPTPLAPNRIFIPKPLFVSGRILVNASNGVTLVWTSQPGRTYRVQYKDSLEQLNWTDVPGDVLAAEALSQKLHAHPATNTQRFYQVIGLP